MKNVLNVFSIGLALLFLVSFIGFSLTGNSILDIFSNDDSGDFSGDNLLKYFPLVDYVGISSSDGGDSEA